MKPKAILTWTLVAFAVVSLGYVAAKETRPATPTPAADAAPAPATPEEPAPAGSDTPAAAASPELVVYYFHGNVRCTTCMNLEKYAHEALEAGFPDDAASGRIEWRTVNVDEPENAHFVQDYQLYTKSLVLSKLQNGAQTGFVNLEKIWDLVSDETAYKDYVRENIAAALGTAQ